MRCLAATAGLTIVMSKLPVALLLLAMTLAACTEPARPTVNLADAAGETPLHLAIAQGRLATVARLLAYGADVNQPDDQGHLPLGLARAQRQRPDGRDIVRLLERNGARAGADTAINPSITTQEKPE